MSGAGIVSAGSMLQQAWDFIASLPDVLVYGIVVVLGLIVLKGLWPSPTSAPTHRSVTTTSPATSSSPRCQGSSDSGTSSAADDASSKADTEGEPAAAAGLTAAEETSLSENESQERVRPSDPTNTQVANPMRTGIDDIHDHSIKDTKDQEYPSRSATPCQHRTVRRRRKKPVTRGDPDETPTRTQVRRHLIDGFDVNTGIEPISTDYTWSVAEIDLGVSGASIDASGELISVDALPSAASYELVDSPIDVSSPSILRLLLRIFSPPSTTKQQTDPPQTQSSEPRESRRGAPNDFHQQKTRAAPQKDYYGQDSGYGIGLPQLGRQSQDQAATTNEPLQPRISRTSDLSHQRPPLNETLDNGLSPAATRTSPGFKGPGSAGNQYESAMDPPVDDIFGGPYLQPREQEETTTGTKPDSPQYKQSDERPVGADYQYSPPQPTLPQTSPASVDIHDERSRKSRGDDPAPFGEVSNPVNEMEHGLEALGIDSIQFGPNPADLAPTLDNNPPDDIGDMLGLGEVADSFEDESLVLGLPNDAEPLLPGMNETGGSWPNETIQF